MKKLITLLSAITLCAGSIPFAAAAEDLTYDINEDGVVDKFDRAAISIYCSLKDGTSDKFTNTVIDDKGNVKSVLTKDYIGYDDALEAKVLKNGDLDGDGEITYKDSNILYDYLFEAGIFVADVNKDGKVTSSDAWMIMDAYATFSTNPFDEIIKDEEFASIFYNSYSCDECISASDASFLLSYIREHNVPGDVDYDGVADPTDASKILKYYAVSSTDCRFKDYFTREEEGDIRILGDVDGDDMIDATDAALILSNYADAQTSK